MPRTLMTLATAVLLGVPAAPPESWSDAYKRGDYAVAATILQRDVFEPAQGARGPDPAALKQLALLYAEGKGVTRDPVLACGLARAYAVAASRSGRGPSATRASQALVERFCAPLTVADRAAAFAAMSCPRIGLQRGVPIVLEPGWSITFNDRSATIVRDGEMREQPLPGDLVCRSQVLLLRHAAVDGATGRNRAARHVIEQVTVQSAWRAGARMRDIVWQLYEVRGLELDLAAVERWQEPGSAWPAPSLPDAIARGVSFSARGTGTIEYAIEDSPPRRGRIDQLSGRR